LGNIRHGSRHQFVRLCQMGKKSTGTVETLNVKQAVVVRNSRQNTGGLVAVG